jgi:endonuclease G, mitochondrial
MGTMRPMLSLPTFSARLPLLLLALATPTLAAATDCPEHFVAGQAPVITQPKIKPRTQEVCFIAFAVLHSGVSRTPLYAAEHLTRDKLAQAKKLSRKDSFHAESALRPNDRAELEDYQRSGYDRGHLAPNADMPTREAQRQSFSLANMVPQIHANNAGVWAGIEAAARQWAIDEGELYVISGPAFIGSNLKKVGNVLVPTHLWKAVYSPKQQRAGVYLITNDETKDYAAISITDLEKMVGLNVLPGVPASVRAAGMDLPKPMSQRGGGNRNKNQPPEEEYQLKDLLQGVLNFIQRTMPK